MAYNQSQDWRWGRYINMWSHRFTLMGAMIPPTLAATLTICAMTLPRSSSSGRHPLAQCRAPRPWHWWRSSRRSRAYCQCPARQCPWWPGCTPALPSSQWTGWWPWACRTWSADTRPGWGGGWGCRRGAGSATPSTLEPCTPPLQCTAWHLTTLSWVCSQFSSSAARTLFSVNVNRNLPTSAILLLMSRVMTVARTAPSSHSHRAQTPCPCPWYTQYPCPSRTQICVHPQCPTVWWCMTRPPLGRNDTTPSASSPSCQPGPGPLPCSCPDPASAPQRDTWSRRTVSSHDSCPPQCSASSWYPGGRSSSTHCPVVSPQCPQLVSLIVKYCLIWNVDKS